MLKLFAIREGFTKKDDMFPKKFFELIEYGPKKGIKIDYKQLLKARDFYYRLAGWSQVGVPKKEKLIDLDLWSLLKKMFSLNDIIGLGLIVK